MRLLPFILFAVGAVSIGPTHAADWQPAKGPLTTRWAKDVSPDKVHPEYPRPQMVREKWTNLNGLWDFAVTGKGEEKAPGQWLLRHSVTVEIEAEDKPAVTAVWLLVRCRVITGQTPGDVHACPLGGLPVEGGQ